MFANSWKGKYSGKITRGQTSGSQSLRRKKQARVVCKNDVWESGGNLRGFCSRLRGKPPVLGATTGGMPRAPYNIGRPHTRTQLVGLVANSGIEIRTTKQRHNNFQQRLRNKKTLAHNCKQLTASLGNQQFFQISEFIATLYNSCNKSEYTHSWHPFFVRKQSFFEISELYKLKKHCWYILPAVRDNFYESSLYWLQGGKKRFGSELMGRGLADLDSNYHSPHASHLLLVAPTLFFINIIWSANKYE